jgi:hypothetical protein
MEAGVPSSFRVVHSEQVRTALRQILTQAHQHSPEFGRQALATVMTIDQELATRPHEPGEPCYGLSNLDLQIRLATIAPLSVTYAVHPTDNLVFVLRYDLLTVPEIEE